MKVLVACEESQRVCIAFREKGYEAYSCDIQECSGGRPEWHILGDVLPILNGSTKFITQDGTLHEISGKWDMIIAHPPCTYLTVTGNRPKLKPTKIVAPPERIKFDSGKTMPAWYAKLWHLPKEERERERSKTFIGIARAMAEQWR